MIKMIETLKYWLIATGVLFLYLFGYKSGKKSEKIKQMEERINVVKNAKQSRDSLNDPARVEWLHNKYKR